MPKLGLFEGYGVELEYMLTDRETLDVRPICDRILYEVTGAYESEIEMGKLNWSNELVLHVIELKTNGPADRLEGLAEEFQKGVAQINRLAETRGAKLLPTAMHPWMDPHREALLWPHEYNPIYSSYDRIFNCQGHGWSNLQSVHLNLPFQGDEEFGRLHAAIRLVLPILPALAASSPIVDARVTGILDTRLDVYRNNQSRVPSIVGDIVPEPVFTEKDYQEGILQRVYRDIAPLDPEGILQYEWLNSRGAIARFMRDTIEIRVLDIQECPEADLAILRAISAVLQALVEERWVALDRQQSWTAPPLKALLLDCIVRAEESVIDEPDYLSLFGLKAGRCTAGQLWEHLAEKTGQDGSTLRVLIEQGTLARRILRAVGEHPSREDLKQCYGQLSGCLAEGKMFAGSA